MLFCLKNLRDFDPKIWFHILNNDTLRQLKINNNTEAVEHVPTMNTIILGIFQKPILEIGVL